MKEDDLLYTLALQKVKGIGDIVAKKLISYCGSAKNIFSQKKELLTKISGIGTYTIRHLFDAENLKEAEKEVFTIQKNNIEPFYYLEDGYPENLKHCADSPILLFQKGNINFSTKKIISIVGTRNITTYGKEFCKNLIEELQPHQPIIVSGFAYGVDIFAHKIAIANELQTLAVLGNGLGSIYPKTHQKYMPSVLENGGFITDFWFNEGVKRENFLKRNRIIAGLSQATLVIESAKKGGSLVTADIANSYNREVFAVPGKATDIYSQGCNNLIKTNQAALITCAEDVIKMLNWEVKKSLSKPIQKQLFITLTNEQQQICEVLVKQGKLELDSISLQCKLPINKVNSLLFELEMKGVVRPLPGKYFELI